MARVNIILPDELLSRLDSFLKARLETRSRFLREAVCHYMENIEKLEKEERRKDKMLSAVKAQDEVRTRINKP